MNDLGDELKGKVTERNSKRGKSATVNNPQSTDAC